MARSFYYHDENFDNADLAERCVGVTDVVPDNPTEIELLESEQLDPRGFFDTALTADKKTVDKNDGGEITGFNQSYHELSEAGKRAEIEHLRDTNVDYFVFIYRFEYADEELTCSLLVEDEGQSHNNNVSLHVDEVVTEHVDIDTEATEPSEGGS